MNKTLSGFFQKTNRYTDKKFLISILVITCMPKILEHWGQKETSNNQDVSHQHLIPAKRSEASKWAQFAWGTRILFHRFSSIWLSILFFLILISLYPRNFNLTFAKYEIQSVSLTTVQRCHLRVCGQNRLPTDHFNEFSIALLCVFKLYNSLLLMHYLKPFNYWGAQAKLLKAILHCSHASRLPPHLHWFVSEQKTEQGRHTRQFGKCFIFLM